MLYVGSNMKVASMIAEDRNCNVMGSPFPSWLFWARLRSIFVSRIKFVEETHGDEECDEILRRVKKLLAYEANNLVVNDWAMLCNGNKIVVCDQGDKMLKVMTEYEKWKENAIAKDFDQAFKDYHDEIMLHSTSTSLHHHHRCAVKYSCNFESVPEDVKCPECCHALHGHIAFWRVLLQTTDVTYDAFGFLEKNRDLLHLDSIQLLSSCKCHLPQIFASNMLTQSEKPVVGPLYKSGGADSQKLSVATKFKVGVLEDTRNRTLRGILRVQSCFRGHQARTYLKQLKRGVTTLQSFIRGWLVRRCSGDIGLLQFGGKKGNECEEVLVKSSFLSELQRRVLRAEAALREKEEENDILHQRLQQYENRWSEYELKMKSMEEVWQKQMRSLQSSLSIAKKSLALDDMERNSDASVNTMSDDRESIQLGIEAGSNRNNRDSSSGVRPMSAGLRVISRLAEEFEQRSQVFGDDAKFLVEVKSGQVDANLNPDRELRRLKQMFEAWKKDYGTRLRETKVILHKLQGNDELVNDKMRKKWWGKRNNSSRFN
nr:myosin-1-like [Ipomoea batatas]